MYLYLTTGLNLGGRVLQETLDKWHQSREAAAAVDDLINC